MSNSDSEFLMRFAVRMLAGAASSEVLSGAGGPTSVGGRTMAPQRCPNLNP